MDGVVASLSVGGIIGAVAASASVAAAIVGLFFRGAAAAYKDERDAAVDKSDRLEQMVNEQAAEIVHLKARLAELEKRTDYSQIIDNLAELTRAVHANTTAVEFLLRQAFPTAVIPRGETP